MKQKIGDGNCRLSFPDTPTCGTFSKEIKPMKMFTSSSTKRLVTLLGVTRRQRIGSLSSGCGQAHDSYHCQRHDLILLADCAFRRP